MSQFYNGELDMAGLYRLFDKKSMVKLGHKPLQNTYKFSLTGSKTTNKLCYSIKPVRIIYASLWESKEPAISVDGYKVYKFVRLIAS